MVFAAPGGDRQRRPQATRKALEMTLRMLPLLVLPAAVAALAGPASAATAPPIAGPVVISAPTTVATQGIIMRDGGICDPIRHMGC
jgi:hypothetical protein